MGLGTLLAGPLLQLLGPDPDIMADSRLYLQIYFGGAVFLFLYNTLNGIYNAQGDSKTPLIFLMISSLTNIVLDLVFIVIFRMGVGASRAQARQLVTHGHFTVNGRPVNIASYCVKPGDVIAVKENKKDNKYFAEIKEMKVGNMPKWLEFDPEKLEGKIIANPAREDIDSNIAEHMIVELYSK